MIDASVFLNAFNPRESGQPESRRLIERLRGAATPIVVPTLLLPELAGAVSRGSGDAELALRFAGSVAKLANMVLVPLDATLARVCADLAARHRLRGADAAYAAVALRFGATLVTRDREQRERAAGAVETSYPEEALSR